MRVRLDRYWLILGTLLLIGEFGVGQTWYNHSEIEWQSFDTEHFVIHFHQGTELMAREAAAIAEKVYGPITEMYAYEPASRTHLIIKDVDDDSNGLAYFYNNKIEIWARPLDYDLRGSHRWMQGVITHEFVHIVQMATAMRFTHRVPGAFVQYIAFEDEKRDDVLYGYPNVLVSYPYPGANIPHWFGEGVAQFMYPEANYDYWDTHRDMLLRDRVLNNNLLSLAAMSSFGKKGIGNESAYNQGFAFVKYIADRFGADALPEISRAMSGALSLSMPKAMQKVTGINGKQLYREWTDYLRDQYAAEVGHIGKPGNILILAGEGTANLNPVWHPSKKQFAYLSNVTNDYFGQTDLYLYDFEDSSSSKLAAVVRSAPVWSADGRYIYYTGRTLPSKTGARWLDLHVYDLEEEEEKRLTHGERATSPVLVDDGQAIAYLSVYDGTSNIHKYVLESDSILTLTKFEAGEYIHSINYRPDEKTFLLDVTLNHGRELYELEPPYDQLVHLNVPQTAAGIDNRDPEYFGDGIVYSTDESGIHNLYKLGPEDQGYLTNVTGGAFDADINDQGEILFSLYSNGAYKVAYLKSSDEYVDQGQVGFASSRWDKRTISERRLPDESLVARPYVEELSKPFLMPRLAFEYGTVKPGFLFVIDEVLGHLNIFGGTSINQIKDTDSFLMFEFMKFRPTLYAEIYAMQRNVSQDSKYYDIPVQSDLRFALVEGVVGARMPIGAHKFWLDMTFSRYREIVTQTVEGSTGSLPFDYYVGTVLSMRWQWSTVMPQYGGNMFPSSGFSINVDTKLEKNGLIDGFSISDYGTLAANLKSNNTARLLVNFEQHFGIGKKRSLRGTYEGQLGWLSNQDIDSFFQFFGGGLPGLKGYTYYDSTAQGNNLMIHTLTTRVPVMVEKHIPLGPVIWQNASFGLVGQVGDAFTGNWVEHKYKGSAGLELRLSGQNFYVYPLALSYEIHRPLNDSSKKLRRHYITLLFEF
ncbi:hypothetical protein ACFL6E_00880 [Candidatus Neomarinimicrobiota bacterium]